jgi:hypothetical protein
MCLGSSFDQIFQIRSWLQAGAMSGEGFVAMMPPLRPGLAPGKADRKEKPESLFGYPETGYP